MNLKKYRIDTSSLPAEAQKKAILFIENNAFTSAYIPYSPGIYETEWEENINPRCFPVLSECIFQELP